MTRIASHAIRLLVAGCFVASATHAAIYCSASTPLAFKGEPVNLYAWNDAGRLSGATWSSETGRIETKGSDIVWNFRDTPPGRYHAMASVHGANGTSETCRVELFYQNEPVFRGDKILEAGQTLLLHGVNEPAGYGLYTYVLLGEPPDAQNTPRVKKVIEAYASLVSPLEEMETYFDRPDLNVVAIPVTLTAKPAKRLTAAELLKNYEFARARALLDKIDPRLRSGPYLVSSLTPIGTKGVSDPYLLQDLSTVPADVVALWVRHFLNQAAQQHTWNATTLQGVLLKTRTLIAVVAQALPDVTKGLDSYLKLVKQGG